VSEGVLQQGEIDALVEAIKDGRIPTSKDSLVPLQHAARLDLTDPTWSHERVIRRGLPVLDLVFDRLGPAIQVTLTKSLRFPVRTETAGIQLMKFGDFRDRLAERACLFEVMRLDPLRGLSVVVLDTTILYALIDALMGGLGVGELPEDREVSDIEESLLLKAHREVLRDFEAAWKPWFPISVEHVRCERTVQVLSTIAEDEVCHIGSVQVAGDVLPASPIYFVMPYPSLEPLLEATSSRVGEENDPNWRLNLVQNLRASEAEIAAVLGSAEMSARAVRELTEGSLIPLGRRVHEEIDLHVEGEPVYKARIGQSRQNYAAKVTQRRRYEIEIHDRTAGQILVRKGLISREQLAVALVDERLNRRQLIDSIVSRGWVERGVLENALRN
jgi:flagellar motor switch protein FliM